MCSRLAVPRIRRAGLFWTFWRRIITDRGQPEIEERVIVVKTWKVESRYQCSSSFSSEDTTNGTDTTKFTKLAIRTRLRTCFFKERWQSGVTPTFLTVSEMGTDALPMTKESGIERAVNILLEEIIMTSVLSSLSFSFVSVIQSFMSSMQGRIESMRSGRRSGVAEFWSWESSAYAWWRLEWRSMTAERVVVYRTKRIWPKTDPWGIPQDTDAGTDVCEWTETDWIRPEIYDEYQSRTVPERLTSRCHLWRRMLWSIVSNAVDRSNEARRDILPSSKAVRRSLTIFRTAVSVECPDRSADWNWLRRLFADKKFEREQVFQWFWG